MKLSLFLVLIVASVLQARSYVPHANDSEDPSVDFNQNADWTHLYDLAQEVQTLRSISIKPNEFFYNRVLQNRAHPSERGPQASELRAAIETLTVAEARAMEKALVADLEALVERSKDMGILLGGMTDSIERNGTTAAALKNLEALIDKLSKNPREAHRLPAGFFRASWLGSEEGRHALEVLGNTHAWRELSSGEIAIKLQSLSLADAVHGIDQTLLEAAIGKRR